METKIITLNSDRDVTLTAYLYDVGGEFGNIEKRPAILILPGGGYRTCSDREAEPVALRYLSAGFQTFILRYSVGDGVKWPQPLEDYEVAMAMIRERAEEWKLYPDKVAVIGFSSGGHLAACSATIAKQKPDAAILGYSVLEEQTVQVRLPAAPGLPDKVNEDTSPCFLFATRTDDTVPISNTLSFASALAGKGIMFELHIYSYGPHGFSTADSSVLAPGTLICPRVSDWIEDSIAWLRENFGEFGDKALTKPAVGKRVRGDTDSFLSLDCTLEHIMKNEKGRALLEPIFAKSRSRNPGAEHSGEELARAMKLSLRTVFQYAHMTSEQMEQYDIALQQIPNIEL